MKEQRSGIWSRVVVFGLVLALVTSGMSLIMAEKARAAGTRDEIILRVAMQDDLKTLNPLVAGDVWTWNVLGYIYDTPLSTDLINDDKFIPYIATHTDNSTPESLFNFDDPAALDATELAKSPIGKVITVHYNFTNVYFHDGHQMDIDDILFSFGVQASMPDWASSVKCLMDKGGESGTTYADTHWLAIEKKSPTTLRFYMQAPYADFIRNTLSVFILPQHIWGMKAGGQDVDNADPYKPPSDPNTWNPTKALAFQNSAVVGSGPFKFESWTTGQQAKINTWRDHFYTPQPQIDGIVYKIYKTAEQAVQALSQGDIDYIAWSIPPTYVPDLINNDDIGLSQSSERGFFYMAYNMRLKSYGYYNNDPNAVDPTTNVKDPGKVLRKAVAHCVNKKEIVERLLQNFGIAADGPVSAIDTEWYNNSLPQYSYDVSQAIRILQRGADGDLATTADNYKLTNPSAAPGKGNWWKNPDGTPIGRGDGGKIEILTPPADYDPIRAQAGLMIATALQDAGIYAESVALDFGTIVQRIDERNFDMFILGWRIGSDPTDFLHAFFHSSTAESGQNYPGYKNASFDAIMDHARITDDPIARRHDIKNAQASVAYDQPYNVLYFRTNIEAYRSDRFVNWTVGPSGSIFSWRSIMGIHAPNPYSLKASFSVETAILSEGETDVIVTVKDQDDVPVQGATVVLEANNGTFAGGTRWYNATTLSNGQVRVKWSAPFVAANASADAKVEIVLVGVTATHSSGVVYNPVPQIQKYIYVKPEGSKFMKMRVETETTVIEAGTSTQVTITVKDQDNEPVSGAVVAAIPTDVGPTVTEETTTDSQGVAYLTFNAPAKVQEDAAFMIEITVSHADFAEPIFTTETIQVLKVAEPKEEGSSLPITTIGIVVAVIVVVAVLAVVAKGMANKKKEKAKKADKPKTEGR